jgi:hypothetical protein
MDKLLQTKKLLDLFGGEVVQNARLQLGTRRIGKNKTYGRASGLLKKGLYHRVTSDGKRVVFGSKESYGVFLHYGVSGTDVKRNTPFSYSDKQPPRDAILQWMKVKPVRLRHPDGRFKTQTKSAMNSAAFLIARSIKKKGIVGLKYYDEAVANVYPKYAKRLAEALGNDIAELIVMDWNKNLR